MRPILLAVLLVLAPSAASLPVHGDDDAGSGGDAGGTPAFALPIARGIVYQGNATPLLDADLYVFEGTAGEHVRLLVEGVGACVDLRGAENEYVAGACDMTEASPGIALATLETTGLQYLLVSTLAEPGYRFGVDVSNERILNDDAGTGRDAPDLPAGDIVVGSGVEYAGDLTTLDVDHYAFDAQAGRRLAFAVEGSLPCLRVVDAAGETIHQGGCALGTYVGRSTWTPNVSGRYFLQIASPAPEKYQFGIDVELGTMVPTSAVLDLEAPPHPPVGSDPTCGTGAPVVRTSGEGAELDGLVFAALKTGFRAVVAWSTPEPVVASLTYSLDGGAEATVSDLTERTHHVFVLESLPMGASLCLTPEGGQPHAIRLANAMNDLDPVTGEHTANLLLLANTQITQREDLEGSLPRFARIFRDATDGHVRIGKVVLVYADLEKHHNGVNSCYPALVYAAPCSHLADVVYTYDSCPGGAACTTLLGVKDREYHVWMSSVWQANAVTPIDDAGAVLAHEMGHYLLGADDVYGGDLNCVDAAKSLSIMGSSRDVTELDDETNRCPDEASIAGYVPSWTLMRENYPAIPERSVIDAGPHDAGDAFSLHVFENLPGVPNLWPEVDVEDDAGSGGDAPDEADPTFLVLPRVVYEGLSHLADSDYYAFEAREGQRFHLATRGPVCGTIVDAAGRYQEADCDSGAVTHTRWIVPEDGVWFLRFDFEAAYRFQFGLDQPASVPLV